MCLEAGYKEHMHTKFYWVLHFPQHLAKHKMLPSCFVQERKHKMIKRLWVLNGRQTPVSAFQSRFGAFPRSCEQALQTRLPTREHGFSLPLGMQPCWEIRQCHRRRHARYRLRHARHRRRHARHLHDPCESLPTLAYEPANDPAMPMDLVRLAVEQKLEELRKMESE